MHTYDEIYGERTRLAPRRMIWRRISSLVLWYIIITLLMSLLKLGFMWLNAPLYAGFTAGERLAALWAGLPMDLAVGGYLAAPAAIAVTVSFMLKRNRWLRVAWRAYTYVAMALIWMIWMVDALLYGYWQFKLDSTPVAYLVSSPHDALASVPAMDAVGGVIAWIIMTLASGWLTVRACRLNAIPDRSRRIWRGAWISAALLVPLFVAIRGGVGVSTMNVSSAYHCDSTPLNHAAVNPAFSLLYSLTHPDSFDREFRFMDEEKARRTVAELYHETGHPHTVIPFRPEWSNGMDSVRAVRDRLLADTRPDIYLVILESFSASLLPSTGGDSIAVGLDRIASDGLLFDRLYASGFRTDRGLPSILSGYPSPPTASVMKYPHKAEHLDSWPRILRDAGYETLYYYGGDDRFTNMRAYLLGAGFGTIVNERSFDLSDRLSKWGVPDHKLFARVLSELRPHDPRRPRLTVIQTSSSHEPFDVPRTPGYPDEPAAVTAFEYTDSCVYDFVTRLQGRADDPHTLVILVPDHYGAWPEGLAEGPARHHVPMVMAGGALSRRGRVSAIGSQTDLAATLLAAMGLKWPGAFSRDLASAADDSGFAWWAGRDYAGIVTPSDTTVISLVTDRVTYGAQGDAPEAVRRADRIRAYLQTVYTDLSRR